MLWIYNSIEAELYIYLRGKGDYQSNDYWFIAMIDQLRGNDFNSIIRRTHEP